eukprot:Trichotokara_eunicae@DN2027_c0_g1_i1.p1
MFQKINVPALGGIEEWSAEELEALLDGVEAADDDWGTIAQRVSNASGNTRTTADCVERFLQLPLEEAFMKNISATSTSAKSFPFLDVSSPLTTNLAFLCSALGPTVAASGARKALGEALTKEEYKKGLLDDVAVQKLTSKAIEGAEERAKEIVTSQENEIRSLMSQLVEKELEKLELSVEKFGATVDLLTQRRNQLDASYKALLAERASQKTQHQQHAVDGR